MRVHVLPGIFTAEQGNGSEKPCLNPSGFLFGSQCFGGAWGQIRSDSDSNGTGD